MNKNREFFELLRSKITTGSAAEFGWVFAGHFLNIILGFVILKILSRMGTGDYGIYALVLTVSTLLSLTFYGPLIQGFIRFYYDYLERKLIIGYLGFVYRTIYITGIIHIIAVVFITILPFFVDIHLTPAVLLFAGIYLLGARTGEIFNAFLSIIRRRKENALIQGGEKLFLAVLLLVLLYKGNLNLLPVFISLGAGSFLFIFIKVKLFNKFVPVQEEPERELSSGLKSEIKGKLISYILPFLIWGLTAWLQLNGEKWIIAGLLSTSDVGIYAVMISLIAALVIYPANIIAEFATPIIFQNYTNVSNISKVKLGYNYIKTTMLIVVLITLFSTALLAFAGKDLIIFISLPEYSSYAFLLPYLCFGTGLYYTGQALATLGLAMNQPRKYLTPKILTGIISITLNYILIYNLGISGTAYAAIITGFIYITGILIVNAGILRSIEKKI